MRVEGSETTEVHDLGLTDKLGRRIGVRVDRYQWKIEGVRRPYHRFSVQQLRDGKTFGRAMIGTVFGKFYDPARRDEECEKALQQVLEHARKAAV